jgi:RNA polymerase sigma-70 factor (ECF subfamily)
MSTMLPKGLTLDRYENEGVSPGLEIELGEIAQDRETAFNELFQRFNGMVYNLAFRILGDREEALDVSQEVFLSIHRKIGRFRGDSSLKTWIYRIAVNRASNRCRWWNRIRRRGTVSLDQHLAGGEGRALRDMVASPGQSPEQALLASERRETIRRTLLGLPVHQRVAVIMRDIDGLSYEEIASALQISLGTVKSRIARGREELKRRINGDLR